MENEQELRELILIVAYSDIPVEESHPLYDIFRKRKMIARRFFEEKERIDKYVEYIKICNTVIKNGLIVW